MNSAHSAGVRIGPVCAQPKASISSVSAGQSCAEDAFGHRCFHRCRHAASKVNRVCLASTPPTYWPIDDLTALDRFHGLRASRPRSRSRSSPSCNQTSGCWTSGQRDVRPPPCAHHTLRARPLATAIEPTTHFHRLAAALNATTGLGDAIELVTARGEALHSPGRDLRCRVDAGGARQRRRRRRARRRGAPRARARRPLGTRRDGRRAGRRAALPLCRRRTAPTTATCSRPRRCVRRSSPRASPRLWEVGPAAVAPAVRADQRACGSEPTGRARADHARPRYPDGEPRAKHRRATDRPRPGSAAPRTVRRTDVEFGRGPLLWTRTTSNGSDLSTLDRSRSVVRSSFLGATRCRRRRGPSSAGSSASR